MKTYKLHRFETVFIVYFRWGRGMDKEAIVARSEAEARKKFRALGYDERHPIVKIEDTDESPYVYFGG